MLDAVARAQLIVRVATRCNTHAARCSADEANDLLRSLRAMTSRTDTRSAVVVDPEASVAKPTGKTSSTPSPSQDRALAYLKAHGSSTVGEIAIALGVTHDNAYNTLWRLSSWNLVKRTYKGNRYDPSVYEAC